MLLIVGDRRQGKTTAALAWMRESPLLLDRVLIVLNNREAERLRALNPDIEPWRFCPIADLAGTLPGRSCAIGIDNLGEFLQWVLRVRVAMVTVNGEVQNVTKPAGEDGPDPD